ncbi:L-serine dehydratase, iron-sulfur-dependent subunit beta [Candidatus Peregrinibacteria bacterium RIFOXYA12_FULL_33_12]|nr:MAG: L-serine dehydratase, iron-sulfur-dependent subunit beta [Candidatus Peregrinibacteria bacterium RIFOXYA12_FULL_33_12]OGJ46037.1 MAG: L-serine dehydratase, iron-sulfur-dependent subunit beta [Candidatus Peregrinibacteria bacterium RIFOXYA2_FULL_33_21]OGJ51742.1 MAG: L-serine dehydratase, iron-sulfur-dependent subunit beta [Candidatus Peregrinibacteria bacterium RIFOXYB2_FULL_33_20]
METWSIFDVIGPVMVGPSSSHTAGACFIGLIARQIFHTEPKKVHIKLHGSFGEVFRGHSTDKAILAGLLNMPPYDLNLSKSMEIANEKKMQYSFESCNLGANVHPNTSLIEMSNATKKITVQGESIGGGKCKITAIDKMPVLFGSEKSCLIIKHDIAYQILSDVLNIITEKKYHIMEVDTPCYKDRVLLLIMIRENFDDEVIKKINKLPGVIWASYSNHFSNYNQKY